MKAIPERSMDVIANEFFAANGGNIEIIRAYHRGRCAPEIAWLVAKLSILMKREGWEYAAIGRFLNRSHATIMYHCKGENGKNNKVQA